MGLTHADRELARPQAVVLAEPAVAVAVWVVGFVFLPEQFEGDALLAQLAVNHHPIGFGTHDIGRHRRREQALLKGRLIQLGWQWIAKPRRFGTTQVFANRRGRCANGAGDFSLGAAAFVMQPQVFCDLAHG